MQKDTLAIHGGVDYKDQNNAIQPPIYATTAYQFEDIEQAVNLFDLKEFGNIYSRITNPTNDNLEKRIALLEGGAAALATSSGHAAVTLAILNIASAGDEIVSSSALYGGTFNLFAKTLKKFGINTIFVNSSNPEDYAKAITSKTKCIYTEMVGNPKLDIPDIEGLAKIAHENKIPLIVDNTVPTPYLCNPIKFGADIVIHSTTKYLSGHGNVMGGIIVDSGNFDWANSGKFKEFTEPDPSYHGMIYTEKFGNLAYIVKARVQLLRDLGTCQSPFNSYLTMLGIETLHLRMPRHSENALKLAEFLQGHELVNWVNYPGLKDHKHYELAKKYLPQGQSSLLGFGLKGDANTGKKFIENVKLLVHAANLGDSRTIVTYPAGTTHRQLSAEQKTETGITDDFIRLSIGTEDIEDIKQDIDQALKASQKA